MIYYIIMAFVLVVSNLFIYKLGYRKGAKRVLNEWREVINYFEESDLG